MSGKVVLLQDDLLIERGSERSCYQHPEDPKRCIKITYSHSNRTQARIKRELKYVKRYKQSPVPLQIIPDYFGTVNTNLGIGHQFELILDYDGRISAKLSDHIKANGTTNYIHEKIISIYHAFLASNAVVSDLHPGNLLLQKNYNDYELIMVDGFGNSDFLKVCDYSKFFTKKKLMRKFTRLLLNLDLPTSDIK